MPERKKACRWVPAGLERGKSARIAHAIHIAMRENTSDPNDIAAADSCIRCDKHLPQTHFSDTAMIATHAFFYVDLPWQR